MKYVVSYSVKAMGETKMGSFTYDHVGEEELNLMDLDLLKATNRIASLPLDSQMQGIQITGIAPLDHD